MPHPTPPAAEQKACNAALRMVLRAQIRVPVLILTDCTYVLKSVFKQGRVTEHVQLVHESRALSKLCPNASAAYIKAHCGLRGNECADALAKGGRVRQFLETFWGYLDETWNSPTPTCMQDMSLESAVFWSDVVERDSEQNQPEELIEDEVYSQTL